MNELVHNAAALEPELDWLAAVADAAVRLYFGHECAVDDVRQLAPPALEPDGSPYARVAQDLSFEDRLVLILALAPQLRPQSLDPLLMKNAQFDRGYTELGGVTVAGHGGFWPTVETAAFLLAGGGLARRFELQALLEPDRPLRARKLLDLDESRSGGNLFAAPLQVHRDCLATATTGVKPQPAFGGGFPAVRLETKLEWDDLVLSGEILEDVEEIRAWIEHRETLLRAWQLDRKIKPGFRSLFYGPPGTGKTLTASLLGKATGLPVYRVDLSMVVSKWVGETEKNLAAVFDQAEERDWILFFDEADALFGKRTQTSSANDRYANQEVAYLLQRVEDFPGVAILASNLKGNLDEAFARRFQSMIYFPLPGPEERLRLWRQAFSGKVRPEPGVDLESLAAEFEITGGGIVNVLRYAALMALRNGTDLVRLQDIRHGIRREFRKDGKVI